MQKPQDEQGLLFKGVTLDTRRDVVKFLKIKDRDKLVAKAFGLPERFVKLPDGVVDTLLKVFDAEAGQTCS